MSVVWTAARSLARLQRWAHSALLAALVGVLGPGMAKAQPLTASEVGAIPTSDLFRLARITQSGRRCEEFTIIMRELSGRTNVPTTMEIPINFIGAILGDIPSDQPSSRPDPVGVFGPRQAEEFARLRREGCSPTGPQVVVGGGATWYDIPQIKGGTQFDPVAGREVPIAHSASTFTGGGGGLFATIPTNGNTLWGDYFFVDVSGGAFDGTGNGIVPIGGNNVAFTYIVPNPISGSTGIFAGPTGQQVQIGTDGHLIDVSLGLKGVTPLPGPRPGSQPFPIFDLHTTAGFRYRNFDTSHTIDQQSLFFPDLHSQIGLDQNSNFFGAQFGVGLLSRPPGPQGGFVGGIHAFVAPGVLSTSGTAKQSSHCGPCGLASPEYDVSLQRGFSDSRFSVIVGGTVHVGYQFNRTAGIFVKGRVEHMTDVPFFQVPNTPVEQPIFIDHGSSTNASVMAGFRVVFDTEAFQTVP